MELDLTPANDIPEFHDPALTGEWATAFEDLSRGVQVPPWCSYLARRDGVAVGVGGFKGPPDDHRWVELAYIIFIPSRSQGLAKALAARLIEIARVEGVEGVLAHTLPEENASTRVLAANGFTFAGAIIDPEDGRVWRWERCLR